MATLRALECLVALIEEGSVSAAAGRLHMSQPALSHQIASLERELGTPVAERLRRGVRPTAAGGAVAPHARVALEAAARAVQVGRQVGIGHGGKLRIACVETMAAWLLPSVLRHWRLRRPEVKLDLIEFSNSDHMTEQVFAGRADFGVGPRPTDLDVELELLGREEMVLVCGADHPYAERASVSVKEIAEEAFIHCHHTDSLASWLDQLASQHRVKFTPLLRTYSSRTAVQLAAAGVGVTIAPVSALAPQQSGAIRRLEPAVHRDIVVIGAAPTDTLVQRFVGDLKTQGVPDSPIPPALAPRSISHRQ